MFNKSKKKLTPMAQIKDSTAMEVEHKRVAIVLDTVEKGPIAFLVDQKAITKLQQDLKSAEDLLQLLKSVV